LLGVLTSCIAKIEKPKPKEVVKSKPKQYKSPGSARAKPKPAPKVTEQKPKRAIPKSPPRTNIELNAEIMPKSEKPKTESSVNYDSEPLLSDKIHQAEQTQPAQTPPQNIRKMRSPVGSRHGKQAEPGSKTVNFSWYGSKQLKLIYTILHDMGDDKVLGYSEFLHFYTIVNEVAGGSKGKTKPVTTLFDRVNDPQNMNTEDPHFIWAFINPQRESLIKKKTIRDVIKASIDNNSKGRKNLLDSVEEVIRNSEKDNQTALKSKYLCVFIVEFRLKTDIQLPRH
jgi:hypothetical protein